MYFHASSVEGLAQLIPQHSNHYVPLVYFSKKRENVLVYLSNAIKKYCIETGYSYSGKWTPWGPYGFNDDGKLRLEEYYPNAIEKTYKGVSGYIYGVDSISNPGIQIEIPDVITSCSPVDICYVEYIEDAYEEILKAEKEALITILRYANASEKMRNWIVTTIQREYKESENLPDYRHFLRGNFKNIVDHIE